MTHKEEWLVRVDNRDFVTNKEGKDKIISAMVNNKRFVSISDKDIISVRHISYISLLKRENDGRIEAPKKELSPLSSKEARKRIAEIKKKLSGL